MRSSKRKKVSLKQISAMSFTQNGRCGICSHPLAAHDIEVDHIIPVAMGGSNAKNNLRLVHQYCNRRRGKNLNQ